MRVVIIGGTGHVGTFLVPRLIMDGYEVICVSRQQREPYRSHPAWNFVTQMAIDRTEAEEKNLFGKQIAELNPDVVIDMICFTPESAKSLAEALMGQVQHFLHCGTLWVHGHSERMPTRENQPRNPFGEYGTNKAAIESYLISLSRRKGFPATILHPGHITGPGWVPINPAGNLDPGIFSRLAEGKEVALPNIGMETVHHVHADDVAQAFVKAMHNWNQAVGESFHIASEQALTFRGYARAVAAWRGREARLRFLPWAEWKKTVSREEAELTWDHIAHSANASIEKAKERLKYQPRYSSMQAVRESVSSFWQGE